MKKPWTRLLLWCALPTLALGGLCVWGALRLLEGEKGEALPFDVPDAFEAALVAGPPLVNYPMFAGFDERGRLFVADSSGANPTPEEYKNHLPHCIRVLEDTDGDGRFDKSTVFDESLNYPEGILWYRGALYVVSPPSLWRLEDTDGDGVADRKTELLTGFIFDGRADDAHGPCLGPDGRLYIAMARYEHHLRQPGGPLVLDGTGSLYIRCRRDGSDAERYCGGVGNPVRLAFTAEGEAIATGTFVMMEGPLRDTVFHAIYGGAYGMRGSTAPHVVGMKNTGELLPLTTRMGPYSPCGVLRYRSVAFGESYRGNFFTANYAEHTLQRHVFRREGATFRDETETLLSGRNYDFYPSDIVEDADGSVLVIDTGRWYAYCGSHGSTLKVKGGIYRLRRKGQAKVPDPCGRQIDWRSQTPRALTALLGDPRFAVRDQALEELEGHGANAVSDLEAALNAGRPVAERRRILWALARIDGPAARAAVRRALDDPDDSVRLTALSGVSLHRDPAARPRLGTLVNSGAPSVRREAATALGRLRDPAGVPALFEGLRAPPVDPFLDHALTFAVIEIGDPSACRAGLRDPSPRVRRAALLALDQASEGRLTEAEVAALLNADDPPLFKVALRILLAHPEWSQSIVRLLEEALGPREPSLDQQEFVRGAITALYKDMAVQRLIVRVLRDEKTPANTRKLLLEIMGKSLMEPVPDVWLAELGGCLEQKDEGVLRQTLTTVRALNVDRYDAVILRLAQDKARPEELRLEALAAVAGRLPKTEPALFKLLVDGLLPERPYSFRTTAAEAAGRLRLDDSQLLALCETVRQAGPMELPRLLPAYQRCDSAAVGDKLVEALGAAPGLVNLSPDAVRALLKPFPAAVQTKGQALLAILEKERGSQVAYLAELSSVLSGGDPLQGRQLFFGNKTNCSACHAVLGMGGKIGPDLSRVGATRDAPALLEAVVFPSASFARGFEPFVAETQDGRVFQGNILRETPDALILVTPDRVEVPLKRKALASITPGRVSIMPQGLERQLTRQELTDLMAYLKSLR